MNALASFAGNFGSRKMSILEIFWCTVGVIIFVIVGTLILNAFKPSKTARGNQLRKLAKTLQFNSLGGGFPESFPKSRTWAADAQSFPFVAGGRRGPHEILFFDSLQKNSQQWTMIAIRSAAGRLPPYPTHQRIQTAGSRRLDHLPPQPPTQSRRDSHPHRIHPRLNDQSQAQIK